MADNDPGTPPIDSMHLLRTLLDTALELHPDDSNVTKQILLALVEYNERRIDDAPEGNDILRRKTIQLMQKCTEELDSITELAQDWKKLPRAAEDLMHARIPQRLKVERARSEYSKKSA